MRINPLNDEFALYTKLGVLEQLITHTGLEVSLLKMFSLRWGRYHEPEYLGNRQYNTAGFGIDLYYLALDYSKTNTTNSAFNQTTYWRLTARVPLAASPENFWPALLRKLRRF